MDKGRLAAFVDGEFTPEEAAKVVMHLASHPQDRAYVDDLFASNAPLSVAFAGPPSEPVPPAIRAALLGEGAAQTGNAVEFPPLQRLAGWAAGGLALALGLAAAALFLPLGIGPAERGLAPGALAAADPWTDLLWNTISGAPRSG